MMPSLFISHGAPNRVISQSIAKSFLQSLAKKITTPKAIIIFSAHWQSSELQVTQYNDLETIHDFMGFSPELYEIEYQVKQPKWLYERVAKFLDKSAITYKTTNRGLDHGAWSVLSLVYPKGDIPVIALSLPNYQTLSDYVYLGETLKELRKEGILIIGSGSATHNLSRLTHHGSPEYWAVEFVSWLQKCVEINDYKALTNLYKSTPAAKMAHPTLEHYIPLLIAAGAAINEPTKLIHDSYEFGSLNNSCFQFG